MAQLPLDREWREMGTYMLDENGQVCVRTLPGRETRFCESGAVRLFGEPKLDVAFDLTRGARQELMTVFLRCEMLDNVDALAMTLYDGEPSERTQLTGSLYLKAQPPNGFDLGGAAVKSHRLTVRFTGAAPGRSGIAFLSLAYRHEEAQGGAVPGVSGYTGVQQGHRVESAANPF